MYLSHARAIDPQALMVRALEREPGEGPGHRVKVALDAQLALGTATGIGGHALDLAAALDAAASTSSSCLRRRLDPWRFDRRVHVGSSPAAARPRAAAPTFLHASVRHAAAAARAADRGDRARHGLAARAGATRAVRPRLLRGVLMKRLYRGAARVIVDSAFSRDEFLALAGGRGDVHVGFPAWTPVSRKSCGGRGRGPWRSPSARSNGARTCCARIERCRSVPGWIWWPSVRRRRTLARCRARVRRSWGSSERVDAARLVGRAELDRLYAKRRLALVPSHYEGFGYALAEALCAGLPVVAARSSSLVEVAGGDAPLVDADDAAGWVDAVRAARRPRRGRSARRRRADAAVARFAWPAAARARALRSTPARAVSA